MALSLSKLLIALIASLTALISALHPSTSPSPPTTSHLSLGDTTITVELAQTPAEQAQGLSDRPSLNEKNGMLFVFNPEQKPAFWMKDMNFPLDMLWINQDQQVIALDSDIATSTSPQTFSPPEPIRYVLEVNAGLSKRHGVKVGDIIPLETALTSR